MLAIAAGEMHHVAAIGVEPGLLGEVPARRARQIGGRLHPHDPQEVAGEEGLGRDVAPGADHQIGGGGRQHRLAHHQEEHHVERRAQKVAEELQARDRRAGHGGRRVWLGAGDRPARLASCGPGHSIPKSARIKYLTDRVVAEGRQPAGAPRRATPSLRHRRRRAGRGLVGRRRREEAAARPVGPLAAPIGAVGRRLCLAEWHRLGAEQPVAGRADADLRVRHHEAVAFAAAPFPCGVAQPTARDPTVVGKSIRSDDENRAGKKPPCKHSGHGNIPLVVPATAIVQCFRFLRPQAGLRAPAAEAPQCRVRAAPGATRPADKQV